MAQYIGLIEDASSASSVVVVDIAESLDISGFTPEIVVSSMPAIGVSSIVLDAPMAVSGTVTTAAPANQNVSGISLDAIQASTATLQADLGNLSGVLNTIVTTSAVDVSGTSLDDIETNTSNISGAVKSSKMDVNVKSYDTTGAVTVEAGDSKIPVQMYAHTVGGNDIILQADADGNLMLNTSASPPTEITSPVLPADSEFLSTATFTFDAGGDIPASDVAVIAAQGVSKRILIYGITISSTGTSGRGYWYLHDGAFVDNGSPYNKCSGAIDAGNGVAVTDLTFPYPVAIRANYAVNISVTEAVSQAYLVGTVYYKVADYS